MRANAKGVANNRPSTSGQYYHAKWCALDTKACLGRENIDHLLQETKANLFSILAMEFSKKGLGCVPNTA